MQSLRSLSTTLDRIHLLNYRSAGGEFTVSHLSVHHSILSDVLLILLIVIISVVRREGLRERLHTNLIRQNIFQQWAIMRWLRGDPMQRQY
jgi:hypothetical protein